MRPSINTETGSFSPASPSTKYATFAPLHYEREYAYPLLVWLHGPGKSGESHLKRVIPGLSLRNYVAVAPRGITVPVPEAKDSSETFYSWEQTPQAIMESEEIIFTAIEAAMHRFRIAPENVFLAGYAEGGTMAVRLALEYPDQFAGAASLCGEFPWNYRPCRQWNDIRRFPLFLTRGKDEDTDPTDGMMHSESRKRDEQLVWSMGMMNVMIQEYEGGQTIAPAMLSDLNHWLMANVTDGCQIE